MFADIKKVVFPLRPIVWTREGPRCDCGGSKDCPGPGKHPAVPYADLEYGGAVARPRPGAGVGIKTGAAPKGSGIFVIDCDSSEAEDWLHERGIPETLAVLTGSGRGHQYYFAHPGFRVKTCAGLMHPSIDVRGDGGMVVAPGSPHRSGGTYTIVRDMPPAKAPAWMLDWLRANQGPAPRKSARKEAFTAADGSVRTGDWLIDLAAERGWLGAELKPGMFAVRCPNEDEHSTSNESSTVIYVHGALDCKHAHCAGMHRDCLALMLGAWPMTLEPMNAEEEAAMREVLDRGSVQRWDPPQESSPIAPWKRPRRKRIGGAK